MIIRQGDLVEYDGLEPGVTLSAGEYEVKQVYDTGTVELGYAGDANVLQERFVSVEYVHPRPEEGDAYDQHIKELAEAGYEQPGITPEDVPLALIDKLIPESVIEELVQLLQEGIPESPASLEFYHDEPLITDAVPSAYHSLITPLSNRVNARIVAEWALGVGYIEPLSKTSEVIEFLIAEASPELLHLIVMED